MVGLVLWSRITKNPDVSNGPLARVFTHLLALVTCSLAQPCSLLSLAPLCSLICLLTHSLARKVVDD